MTKPIKWGLMAAVSGVLLVLLVVWSVQRYQDRLERETHAPERLQQRLMAVQAGDGTLQAEDLASASCWHRICRKRHIPNRTRRWRC